MIQVVIARSIQGILSGIGIGTIFLLSSSKTSHIRKI